LSLRGAHDALGSSFRLRFRRVTRIAHFQPGLDGAGPQQLLHGLVAGILLELEDGVARMTLGTRRPEAAAGRAEFVRGGDWLFGQEFHKPRPNRFTAR